MKTIEQYLKEYPNSSLKDYSIYLIVEHEKENQEKKDSRKRHEDLLKSYTGKCFRVDFNDTSSLFFKVKEEISLEKRVFITDAYRVSKHPTNDFHVYLEHNESILIAWLPNQEEWNGSNYYYVSSNIISEESFNEIVKYYEAMAEMVNAIKNIKK